MRKWGIIGENEEMKTNRSEIASKRFKLTDMNYMASPFTCIDPSLVRLSDYLTSMWINVGCHSEDTKEATKEIVLRKRVDILEKQCALFAKKLAFKKKNSKQKNPRYPTKSLKNTKLNMKKILWSSNSFRQCLKENLRVSVILFWKHMKTQRRKRVKTNSHLKESALQKGYRLFI